MQDDITIPPPVQLSKSEQEIEARRFDSVIGMRITHLAFAGRRCDDAYTDAELSKTRFTFTR